MEEHNLLVVSDTHLCGGFDPESGKFSRLEDFLADDAFARFLQYHQDAREQPRFGGRPWLLILNGDVFDFLQVVSLPQEGEALRAIKGKDLYEELRRNERDYGLGTAAKDSEWKMGQVARGHPAFFAALGRFVADGNQIAVTKGNHDIELFWPLVWRRFVVEVREAYEKERQQIGIGRPLDADELTDRMQYYPWFYHEPGRVYVEHGGQYEAANYYPDYLNPVIPHDPTLIQLPWGSLFGRYVFNKLEDVLPFADNVRPASRYFLWSLRKAPLDTLKLVGRIGTMLRAAWNIATKRTWNWLARPEEKGQDEYGGPNPLPAEVATEIAALARKRVRDSWNEWAGGPLRSLLSLAAVALVVLAGLRAYGGLWVHAIVYAAVAVLTFVLQRVVRNHLGDSFADYLLRVAHALKRILGSDHAVRYIVLGHDHQVAMERLDDTGDTWYVNAGTWVRVFHAGGPAEGREEPTFFRLIHGHEGAPELLRWDDATGTPSRVTFGLDV